MQSGILKLQIVLSNVSLMKAFYGLYSAAANSGGSMFILLYR